MPRENETQPGKSALRRVGRRIMIHFLLIVVGFYAVFCAAVYALQRRLIYFPSREIDFTPSQFGFDFEDVVLSSGGGKDAAPAQIAAWFVPSARNRGTLLFCHGNAGNISHRLESIEIFHRLGLNVFIFDYRGYGKSAGAPSEKGLYADAWAARDYLTRQRGVAPREIVVFGESLGGAVAAWLAAEVGTEGGSEGGPEGGPGGGSESGPGALILGSTFSSLPDLGAALYPYLPVRLLARERYDTRERMGGVACPVLVAHSRGDEIVPYAQGRAVFEAARGPKAFLELRGDHNGGFLITGQAYVDGIDSFLRECFDRSEKQATESP